jgi:dolichol kinase/phosphoserine phosphatase
LAGEKQEKPRLIIFDVEGVLIPKNRFVFDVGIKLGIFQLLKMLFNGFLYEIGIISLKTALKRIFKVMMGMKIEELLQTFEEIPLKPRLRKFFAQLSSHNFKTALISSGLPRVIVEKLAETIGADYAFGIEVDVNSGALTGEIWGDVIDSNGKRKVLTQIISAEGFKLEDCVVVADDRNNSCIFLPEMKKIGFNPDFVLRFKADEVVTENLSAILSLIENKPKSRSLPSKNAVVREIIHASGFFVSILGSVFGVTPIAVLICAVSVLYFLSEVSRIEKRELPIISVITRSAASQVERYEFAAAPLYFAIGILVALLLFPIPVNFAAIAIFCLGDSTASLFGGMVSSKPLFFNKGKTFEGSLVGLFFAFIAGSFFVSPALAIIGATVAMIIESLPLPVNDNLSIPICTGLALMMLF